MRIHAIVCILLVTQIQDVTGQEPDDKWWNILMKAGLTCKPETCRKSDETCECYLTIEHRLTMMEETTQSLLLPSAGRTVRPGDTTNYNNQSEYSMKYPDANDVITANGYGSRIVIAVNRKFPGPAITAYENQKIIVHMRNLMHTDSTTIHFHGMHQKKTPWSDGVAFVSQCPILPGQIYTYKFYGKPFGTSFYHAHIGDQRSAGLYGPLIIIPISSDDISVPQDNIENVHTVAIQDWNHFDEPETLYQRMLFGVFDPQTKKRINTTSDISGAKFSRYHCHSGLINGKGRFYNSSTSHNGSPLTTFDVKSNMTYRFRVIGAATLYPFRVYVQHHPSIRIVASDGFEIKPIEVESFIIQPGERIDFLLTADQTAGNYLLVAETIEVEPETRGEYHAAEAIIHYTDADSTDINPSKGSLNTCTSTKKCKIFNCPFLYYPTDQNQSCLTWNDATTNDPNSNIEEVRGEATEKFYNFAFPGNPGYTPGSVNGHQFLPPTVAAYAEWNSVPNNCGNCNATQICECTYYDTIDQGNSDRIYQFVMTNIGNGSGWSHPIHLHGHSFYVMKMGFASYDEASAKLIPNTGQDQQDITCPDDYNFCSTAKWKNASWSNGNHPSLNWNNPPQKDTIIVPTGGYVVIRFKADNPGLWFFHCHIDLHNTNGMGMMINESPESHMPVPEDFPRCKSFIQGSTSSVGSIEICSACLGICLLVEFLYNIIK